MNRSDESSRRFEGIWIPKEIWLNDELNLTEKCLFVEISSLSTLDEGCFAGNERFAKFLGVTKDWASRLIAGLIKKGYIQAKYTYKAGSKEVERRYLVPLWGYGRKIQGGIGEKSNTPIGENSKDNNTATSNTNENISPKRKKKEFTPPTVSEVKEYIQSKGYNVDPQYFVDYYASANWHFKDGKPVKNWKQCLVTWNKNNYGSNNNNQQTTSHIPPRETTPEEIAYWRAKYSKGRVDDGIR